MKQKTLHEKITAANAELEKRHGRQMPFDEASEKFVLGCILVNELSADIAFENIGFATGTDAPFYSEKNRLLFEICRQMYVGKSALNLLTVTNYIKTNRIDAWTFADIQELTNLQQHPSFLAKHCRLLLDLHNRRRLISEAEYIATEGFLNEQPLEDLLGTLDSAIIDIRNERKSNDPVLLSDINIEDRHNFTDGFKTGIAGIDEKLHHGAGAQGGDYIIIAARPSVGKSTLAVNFSAHGSGIAQPSLFFSLEMTGVQIASKFFEYYSGCPYWKLDEKYSKTATVYPDEHRGILWYRENRNRWQVFVDDSSFVNPLGMRGQIARMKRKCDIKAVFVDYMQLIKPVNRYPNQREREVSETSSYLKAIAKEFNIPVFVLSQLNRQSLSRADKLPSLGDLRESGSLEQDADVVILLHDGVMAERGNDAEERDVELIIAKNRLGACGSVMTKFKASVSKFTEDATMPKFTDEAKLVKEKTNGQHKEETVSGW